MRVIKQLSKFNLLLQCSCGEYLIAKPSELKRLTDCGCGIKHTEHPLYNVWKGMKARCYNKNHRKYPRYGGRGITVCEEWINDFESFAYWGMDNGYKKGLQIDRIDNNSGYSKDNCRFVTQTENQRNKENTRFIEFQGKVYPRGELAEITGINRYKLTYLQKEGLISDDTILKLMRRHQVSTTHTSEEEM